MSKCGVLDELLESKQKTKPRGKSSRGLMEDEKILHDLDENDVSMLML